MLNFSAGQTEYFLPPIIRREIQIRRPDQVANPAALVGFLDPGPHAVKFLLEVVRFVSQHHGLWQQIEQAAISAGDRRVKLPPGKHGHAPGAHGLFHSLLRAADAFSRKAGMNRPQKLLADWSLSK